jgi:hypothetical protein
VRRAAEKGESLAPIVASVNGEDALIVNCAASLAFSFYIRTAGRYLSKRAGGSRITDQQQAIAMHPSPPIFSINARLSVHSGIYSIPNYHCHFIVWHAKIKARGMVYAVSSILITKGDLLRVADFNSAAAAPTFSLEAAAHSDRA